jgi:phytoene/squalene synthetase
VREDWELGRVYLPQDELSSFGVSEADIAAGNVSPAWQALMTFQAERARAYLQDGLGLLRSLDSRSALCVSTFAGLYRATLDRIETRNFDVFDGPPHLSALTKLRIVGQGLW